MFTEAIQEKRDKLQDFVGEHPLITVSTFENWGKTQKRSEILSCSPKSLEEIQAVVKGCRHLAIRVRAAGATHSWTPLFSDDGNLVMYTKDLKRHDGQQIELIQNMEDPCDKKVTVMTNVTIGELMEFEVNYGVCLPCNVVLRVVTCGGVVATACHGVGKDCKCISDYITSMRIIDSEGNLRTYSLKKDGKDVMRAVQGNFGLFGIIYDVTFIMDNLLIVETRNIFPTVQEAFYDKDFIRDLYKKNWSVEIFWFPFNSMECGELSKAIFESKVDWGEWDPKKDKVWIRLVNKVESAGKVEPAVVYTLNGIRSNIELTLGQLFDKLITNFPSLTPHFTRSFQTSLFQQLKDKPLLTQQLPHAIHYRDFVEKLRLWDMEWALDCDETYDTFCKATQHVVEKVKVLATEGQFPLNVVMEMRLMGHSDVYLSPALAGNPDHGGSGHTLYLEILSLVGTHEWETFSSGVANFWMTLPGARPHWAKQWAYIDGIRPYLEKMYKKEFAKFREQIRVSNADPNGIFLNNCLEKLLYPNGHIGWNQLKVDVSKEEKQEEKKKPAYKFCCL